MKKKLLQKYKNKLLKPGNKYRWGIRHFQIRYKYAMAFLIIGVLFILAGGFVFWQLQGSQDDVADAERESTKMNDMLEFVSLMQEKYGHINYYVASGDDKYIANFKETQDSLQQLENEIASDLSTNKMDSLFTVIENENKTIDDLFLNSIIDTVVDGNTQLAKNKNNNLQNLTTTNIEQATELTQLLHDRQTDFINSANQKIDTATWVLFIAIATVILLGIAILIFVSRPISRNLNKVAHMTSEIATGNLATESVDYESRDEIGQLSAAANKMKDNLQHIVTNVLDVSSTVSSQSTTLYQSAQDVKSNHEQIASTMEELSAGAESQANSATNLSENMSQFLKSIQASEEQSQAIAGTSENVARLTTDGATLMDRTTSQMNRIDEIVTDAVKKVEGLDQHSDEISNLVLVIKAIADQTNLLSLNAAIEAARAGEHGKGFAVVADEVRKLSNQVNSSITEITHIVDTIQKETSQVVVSLNKGYEEVKAGTEQMAETGQSFSTISTGVSNMADKISSISHNMHDISQNGISMNGMIEDIASVSQESAAGVEQTAASSQETASSMEEVSSSAQELERLAEQMHEEMKIFKL